MPEKSHLTYDAVNMFRDTVGEHGAAKQELKQLESRLRAAKVRILQDVEGERQGWLYLPSDREMVKRIDAAVKAIKRFSTCLVIGIGGSDLGTRALLQALEPSKKGMEIAFAGANTDPDELFQILSRLDLKKTLVNIISKSGDTLEPMATFRVVYAALKKAIGKRAHEHVLVTTNAERGTLRTMAEREKFMTLPVPSNVGGRFSVLSDVGLFPLACAGIDIKGLLKGAREERDAYCASARPLVESELFAALNYLAYTKRHQTIQILMPYTSRLRAFGDWYRQLWAESLGKKESRRGDIVHIGPTPAVAIGATDQHSQIQLYNEGPFDKTVTFVEVERFDHAIRDPESKHSFQDIIHAERQATAEALRSNERPNGTIHLPRISAYHLGELIMFFEIATAISGELYDIDAYNQPGVEAGKVILHKYLKPYDR